MRARLPLNCVFSDCSLSWVEWREIPKSRPMLSAGQGGRIRLGLRRARGWVAYIGLQTHLLNYGYPAESRSFRPHQS